MEVELSRYSSDYPGRHATCSCWSNTVRNKQMMVLRVELELNRSVIFKPNSILTLNYCLKDRLRSVDKTYSRSTNFPDRFTCSCVSRSSCLEATRGKCGCVPGTAGMACWWRGYNSPVRITKE